MECISPLLTSIETPLSNLSPANPFLLMLVMSRTLSSLLFLYSIFLLLTLSPSFSFSFSSSSSSSRSFSLSFDSVARERGGYRKRARGTVEKGVSFSPPFFSSFSFLLSVSPFSTSSSFSLCSLSLVEREDRDRDIDSNRGSDDRKRFLIDLETKLDSFIERIKDEIEKRRLDKLVISNVKYGKKREINADADGEQDERIDTNTDKSIDREKRRSKVERELIENWKLLKNIQGRLVALPRKKKHKGEDRDRNEEIFLSLTYKFKYKEMTENVSIDEISNYLKRLFLSFHLSPPSLSPSFPLFFQKVDLFTTEDSSLSFHVNAKIKKTSLKKKEKIGNGDKRRDKEKSVER